MIGNVQPGIYNPMSSSAFCSNSCLIPRNFQVGDVDDDVEEEEVFVENDDCGTPYACNGSQNLCHSISP